MAKTVYGNAVDLANAKSTLGNGYTYVDTSAGGKYTPGLGDLVVGGTGAVGGLANAGQGIRLAGSDRDATLAAIQGYANQQNYTDSLVKGFVDQVKAANDAAAEATRIARQGALTNAFQNNSQALNSQKSSVTNNYDSMTRQLNATKEAQLPQYQAQRDAASSDAAAQLRRTQALNALSGKYFSGANRSQQLAVDLAKQNAIGGINQAQNQFNTDITNRLSDADAQRVAALNDIAEKLRLTEQQYNQGTLDLTNQIESQKAAGAAQAMADAMKWAQGVQQQGVDNGLRQGQLDLSREIFSADQAYRDKTFGASQGNQALQTALAISGLLGQTYGVPGIADGTLTADQAYRNAALARSGSGSSGGGYYGGATNATQGGRLATADVYQGIDDAFQKGADPDTILANLQNSYAQFIKDGVSPQDAINYFNQRRAYYLGLETVPGQL